MGQSQLPSLRFDDRKAYSSIGVDYLAPLYVLPVYGAGTNLFKVSVVLYTCAASRGLILDVVSSATSKAFIHSLRRFIARRGCPSLIISDNGSVFTADDTQSFAASRYITWQFNVSGAPWWGGIWERLVGSVKRCIKKVVGVRRLGYTELQTLLLEIECVLNNRPLCPDYDSEVVDVLTPNHLVFGRRLENINFEDQIDVNFNEDSTELNKVEKRLLMLITQFWKIWRKEYLILLRAKFSKTRVYN